MQPLKFIDSMCPSRSPSRSPSRCPTTRRTFLGDSLGTTVGIASTLGIASTNGLASLPTVGAFVSGSDHLRVGLIGCGGRGTGAAMQAAAADRGVQIVAMGDLFADQLASSARLLARDLGAQFACPPERQFIGDQAYKMVLDAGVDAVLLTTPPQARPLHLATAVGQGKHVFCEMPVAVDIAGVHQVAAACALARATKVSIVSGLCFRSDAPTVELMRRIHAGSIGHPLAVRVGAAIGLPWRKAQPTWNSREWRQRNWISFAEFSGGDFVEHHVHAIDKALWAFGDACPVSVVGSRLPNQPNAWSIGNCLDGVAVRYLFADGSVADASCQRAERFGSRVEETVFGSKGRCDLRQPVSRNREQGVSHHAAQTPNRYQAGMNVFVQAVRLNAPVQDGDLMCRSTLAAIMGRLAAESGHRIMWDEIACKQKTAPVDSRHV